MVKALRWVDGGAVSEAVERIHGWRGGNGENEDGARRKSRTARSNSVGTALGFRQWIIAQSIVAIGSVGIGLTTFVARLVFVQIYPESSA